jgi:hypothetical protein
VEVGWTDVALHLLLVALLAGLGRLACGVLAMDLGEELEKAARTLQSLGGVVDGVADGVGDLADDALIWLIGVGSRHDEWCGVVLLG